jgi:hypothetical protein
VADCAKGGDREEATINNVTSFGFVCGSYESSVYLQAGIYSFSRQRDLFIIVGVVRALQYSTISR